MSELCIQNFELDRIRNAEDLFALASWANAMAKKTRGQSRLHMYDLKNCCLSLLRKNFESETLVKGDMDKHRGLESVSLQSNPRRRLHTHPNWYHTAA